MAASRLNLINTALVTYLGEKRVTAITDTQAATRIDGIYDEVLREVLRDYQWGFATKRAQLVQGTLTTEEALEWAYIYTKPTDWIRTLRLSESGDFERSDGVYFADEQNRILSNSATLYMLYTFAQTDTMQFDPTFDQVFPLALAVKASWGTTQSTTLSGELSDMLRVNRVQARNRSAQDQRPKSKPVGRFRKARYGSRINDGFR